MMYVTISINVIVLFENYEKNKNILRKKSLIFHKELKSKTKRDKLNVKLVTKWEVK